jgi:hypothetical protein
MDGMKFTIHAERSFTASALIPRTWDLGNGTVFLALALVDRK